MKCRKKLRLNRVHQHPHPVSRVTIDLKLKIWVIKTMVSRPFEMLDRRVRRKIPYDLKLKIWVI